MFQAESLSKNFIRGLAFLDSYIKLNNKTRLQDINIISEQFCCQLLNALYGWELADANTESRQMPGYDLISEKDRIIVQITSQCTKSKVQDSMQKLEMLVQKRAELIRNIANLENVCFRRQEKEKELKRLNAQLNKIPDLTGYQLRFLFLTTDASSVRKSAEHIEEIPYGIQFDPELGIMDFTTLARFVQGNCMRMEQMGKLERFISMNSDLFVQNIPSRDHVQEIIDEYAQNFQSELFMHRGRNNMVTLQNLYVEPAYQYVGRFGTRSRDVPGLLCDFLWQRPENDDERLLFIEGDAAIGKTSLVSWLCYHYNQVAGEVEDSVGEAIFLNRKVVCIRLRELEFNQGGSAKDMVLRYLDIDNQKTFKQRYAGAILILDGADELSMVSGSQTLLVESFLQDLQRAFQDHKFIITTRPKFLDLNHPMFRQSTFGIRRVELLHYNTEMRAQWLENYKRCGETISPATEEYIASLSDVLAEGVADTPLALYLLVKCRIRNELQGNSWALYREIFSSAITDGRYNQNFEENSSLMTPIKAQTNYRVVQNIAYRMFQNAKEDRYYLNTDEIDEVICASELNGLTKEQVRSTCVLCAYWKNATTLGALEFYHNNIRDFFFCEYISETLIRCIRGCKEEDQFQTLITELCRLFCWGDISGTTWEQTFTFLRLRLMFEKEHDTPYSLYTYLRQVENLPNVIWHLFVSKNLWCHPSPDVPYVSGKRVFANAMMLVRILMDTEQDQIEHCSDEEQLNSWIGSGVFRDWKEILSQSVKLSNQQIGVASKTKWKNFDWSGFTLWNVDFRESRLVGINFSSAHLGGCDFQRAEIRNCLFQGSEFHRVNFGGAVLHEVIFDNTDLRSIQFDGAQISHCRLKEAQLGKNQFLDCVIENLEMNRIRLNSFHFSGSRLLNCSFIESNFASLRIDNHSEWENVDCSRAIISGDISNSRFVRVQFNDGQFLNGCRISSEFTESEFDRVKWAGALVNAKFIRCRFVDCDFSGIDLFHNVVFEDCRFDSAVFRRLVLESIEFRNAVLRNATFTRAKLNHCIISGAQTNLQGANFAEAKNMNSVFSDVDLSGARFHNGEGFV